ncbi:hypothetical protein STEG23_003842 [Scotinomys teguina]
MCCGLHLYEKQGGEMPEMNNDTTSGCGVWKSVVRMGEDTCIDVNHPVVLLSCPKCMNRGPELNFHDAYRKASIQFIIAFIHKQLLSP